MGIDAGVPLTEENLQKLNPSAMCVRPSCYCADAGTGVALTCTAMHSHSAVC